MGEPRTDLYKLAIGVLLTALISTWSGYMAGVYTTVNNFERALDAQERAINAQEKAATERMERLSGDIKALANEIKILHDSVTSLSQAVVANSTAIAAATRDLDRLERFHLPQRPGG